VFIRSRDSADGTGAGLRTGQPTNDGSIPEMGKRISLFQSATLILRPTTPPIQGVLRKFPPREIRDMKLTAHIQLMAILRTEGAIPPPPTSSVVNRKTVNLLFLYCSCCSCHVQAYIKVSTSKIITHTIMVKLAVLLHLSKARVQISLRGTSSVTGCAHSVAFLQVNTETSESVSKWATAASFRLISTSLNSNYSTL
jgi:hypothetical protein